LIAIDVRDYRLDDDHQSSAAATGRVDPFQSFGGFGGMGEYLINPKDQTG